MKETEYKVIQIEDDFEFIIGEIFFTKENKFIKADLFATTIGADNNELENIRKFINIVEQKMVNGNLRN